MAALSRHRIGELVARFVYTIAASPSLGAGVPILGMRDRSTRCGGITKHEDSCSIYYVSKQRKQLSLKLQH